MGEFEKEIKDAKRVVLEFLAQAKLKKGELVVIGCSTSEIASQQIGSYSNEALGEAVFVAMYEELRRAGLAVATQCCEHLNRALIMTQADCLLYTTPSPRYLVHHLVFRLML